MESSLHRLVLGAACFVSAVSAAALGQAPPPADAALLPAAAGLRESESSVPDNLVQPAPAPAPSDSSGEALPELNFPGPAVPKITVVNFPSGPETLPTVDATVTQRISRDSDRIGAIAKKLLNVQKAIGTVEKEALDKVFDIHSIRSFLNEHQAAVDKEKHLDQEIVSIAAQEKALTGKLTQVNVDMDGQLADHDTRVQKLKLKLAEGKSKIQQLKIQMAHARMLQKEIKMLPAVDEELAAKNEKAAAEEARLEEEIKSEEDHGKEVKEAMKIVDMQLGAQLAYKAKCTSKLSRLRAAISAVKEKKAAEKRDIQEKLTSASGTQQRLLKDNDVLRQRLQKAEANKATIRGQIAIARANLAALQEKGQEAVEAMKTKLATSQQEEALVRTQLAATVSNLEILEKDIMGTKEENIEMNKQIEYESGYRTSLEANHSHVQLDLASIDQKIKLAEETIARANEQTAKYKARAEALRQEAKASANQAATETKQLMAKVSAAEKQDEELVAKVKAATKDAQSSVMIMDCVQAWDRNHTEVRKLLENCNKLEEELQTTRDHVDMLKQSLGGGDLQHIGMSSVDIHHADTNPQDDQD